MSARPEADPQLGRTLGGQYRIEALLGAGGMGRVYRGRQLSVNRPVAIKVIAGQAPHPREWVQRFRREAEATASLSHPNSVRLFDFGVTESEELFMVMELLEGIDLARQLQAHGPLPLVAALAIARQVLLALCEAHALGITHRDIKPDNIFLASVRGADVVAKVMDFGIAGIAQAQRKSRLTGAGMIIGTPMYMSPEQAQGLRVDGKSDVYSVGVVLFEMLTGRPVFESHTAVTLLLAHVARAPMRLEEAGVQLREHSSLQTLLDRLLAKDPNERPSAAEALDTVTGISTRLGIAGATGSMRALDLSPAAPPASARRGTQRSAAARDAHAPSGPATPAARDATPPSAAEAVRAAPLVAGADRHGDASAGASDGVVRPRTGPQSGTDHVPPSGFNAFPGPATPPSEDAFLPGSARVPDASQGEVGSSATPLSAADAGELNTSPRPAPTGAPELDEFRERAASAAREQPSDRAERAFQSARAPSALTGAQLRPGLVILGAGLVLSAASALAFRWAPSLIDAAKPLAAVETLVATPEPAPVPAQRTVLIDSQPSAAQVLVDGEQVGSTPYSLHVRADTVISVAREGYARQLVKVPYDSRAPLLVKLAALPDHKPKAREEPPPVYSIKQESQPRIAPRSDTDHERRDRELGPAPSVRVQAPQPAVTEPTERALPKEHAAQVHSPTQPQPQPQPISATATDRELRKLQPSPARTAAPTDHAPRAEPTLARSADAEAEVRDRPQHEPQPDEQPHGSGLDVARVLEMGREPGERETTRPGRSYSAGAHASERERAAEIASEHTPSREYATANHEPPSAPETSRSAATHIEAVREDELDEIALDDDERAHVAQHYGLRAIGRAVARAFGRLLIPYPNRDRRAALAKMPLSYPSFREARAAYKQRDVDATAFQEAVWQLRERRRQRIWAERDRYARGELTQGQYEACVDRIWDEFWGPR